MANLKHIELEDNGIGVEGVRAIASSKQMTSLCTLNLTFNSIGDEGVDALLAGSLSKSLRSLHLEYCDLTDASAYALAADPRLAFLTTLEIGEGNDEISNDGMVCAASLRTFV